MPQTIIVAGPPYSGKTTFCEKLSTQNPAYKHLNFDHMYAQLNTDGELFFKYLELFNPKIAFHLQTGCTLQGIKSKTEMVDYYRTMVCTGQFEKKKPEDIFRTQKVDLKKAAEGWTKIMEMIGIVYLADMLKQPQVQIPVVEGLFINRESRQSAYEDINDRIKTLPAVPGFIPLDEQEKMLIFINPGLETSLKRLKHGKASKYAFVRTTKEQIRTDYARMEIPREGELPNTTVRILRTYKDLEKCITELSTAQPKT